MGKVDCIKINIFAPSMKRQGTDWEKLFSERTSDKELIFKMHKELFKTQ